MQKMAVMALALGTALTLSAQQGPGPQGPGGPGGPRPGFGFGPRMGFFPGPGPFGPGGPVVTNHPYTDSESSSDTMTRRDGKTVTRQVSEQKWRDAAGRTRAEFTAPAEGNRPAVHRGEIFDPVARTVTSLDFNKKVAVVRQLPPPPQGQRRQRPQGGPGQRPMPPGVTVTETDLPGKQIAGVYATGKQTTRTVAAGTHGNAEAMTQTSQRYVSPDLKIVLFSQENGPRNSAVHQVTALTQADQDAALFSVPQDFSVRNAPLHGFRGPRGPRGPGGQDGPPPAPGE